MHSKSLFKNRLQAACATVFCAMAIGGISRAQDADLDAGEIVNQLHAYYATAEDYKVAFVQTTSHKMFAGRLQRAYGELMYKKGGLMRWEYKKPETKSFIYDGKMLWVYEPEVPQVFKGAADAERLRRALAFLTGEDKILDEYKAQKANARKCGFDGGFVLKLYPKDKKSSFKNIELYIHSKDFHVVRSVVVDHDGNRNRLDFENPITNSGISAETFKFAAPQGVPVIDADKVQPQ